MRGLRAKLLLPPLTDFCETVSRVILYLCAFVYIFPVLEYQINGDGAFYVVQLLLQITRYVTLALLLLNIPITTYEPFGRAVDTQDAFLTQFTTVPTYYVVSVLALGLLTVTRQDEVEFVFSNINQTESFNLTAYLEGSLDFFTEGVTFQDELDSLVEDLFVYAQHGLFFASIVFSIACTVRDRIIDNTPLNEAPDWKKSWYVRTWQQRAVTTRVLGLPRRGPLLRNGCLCVLAGLATLISVIDFITAEPNAGMYNVTLVFIAETLYGIILFSFSLWKVVKNLRQNTVVYPAYLVETFPIMQLQFYVAITSPTLTGTDLRLIYAAAAPVAIIVVWLVTFNRRLPNVVVWTVRDINKIVIVNLREPFRFFRLFYCIAIAAGILAAFFSYYAYIGNAFEFDFTSGDAVDSVQEVVDGIEDVFDNTILEINAFVGAITPCSATESTFWSNATSLGGNGQGDISAADSRSQLRQNDYFDVCFDGTGANADFLRPPTDPNRCQGPIDNYDELLRQEAEVTSLDEPTGVTEDTEFVDDEGNPVEPGFQVLKIDPQCEEALCIAFTVLTIGLFAATLIPFVNIGAAAASKAARIAWRISRMGRRMLKYVRKIYAKRSKLRRFTKLIRRLAAIGNPVLKFDLAIFFLLLPLLLVGLLCILLGFFRRTKEKPILDDAGRTRVLFVFTGLTLFNFALLVGFFGLTAEGDNSLRFVQGTMDQLPPAVIKSSVNYGSGMLYLRTCLAVSIGSSAAMAISLATNLIMKSAKTLGRRLRRRQKQRQKYERIEVDPSRSVLNMGKPNRALEVFTIGAQRDGQDAQDEKPALPRLNYAILVVFLILPVSYLAYWSFNDPTIRWFKMNALQDDRTADITEQVASSEVVADSVDIINTDVSEEERACGFIAVAVEEVFNVALNALRGVTNPLLQGLQGLQATARNLLGQIRIGTLFAPINLNLPLVDKTEFFIVFTLPLVALFIAVISIVTDMYARLSGNINNQKVRFILESTKAGILGIGLAAFQIDLVIYSVFSALNGLDVPLFNVEVQIGSMLLNSLYCSILCVTAGVSLYTYEYLL